MTFIGDVNSPSILPAPAGVAVLGGVADRAVAADAAFAAAGEVVGVAVDGLAAVLLGQVALRDVDRVSLCLAGRAREASAAKPERRR